MVICWLGKIDGAEKSINQQQILQNNRESLVLYENFVSKLTISLSDARS